MTNSDIKFSYLLERSPAMKVLGALWTGSIVGQVMVAVLLFIGVLFMGDQGFSILSIIFFAGFILPVSYFMHIKFVRRGKMLMKPWCKVKIENDVLSYKSGFPNTMIFDWQEIPLDNNNRDFVIKGNDIGGYHLRLSGDAVIRLGLWVNVSDARKAANELAVITKGTVSEELSNDESVD